MILQRGAAKGSDALPTLQDKYQWLDKQVVEYVQIAREQKMKEEHLEPFLDYLGKEVS